MKKTKCCKREIGFIKTQYEDEYPYGETHETPVCEGCGLQYPKIEVRE